jgi:PhzF family phenazine biosynthesis protein
MTNPSQRPFQLIDVFHDGAFSGNPLAVVFDADDLAASAMQTMTRWLNLSETAFLLRPSSPKADYRVRIFTLDRELPFAGHPTLGSCHAWLSNGGTRADGSSSPDGTSASDESRTIVQECGAGLVEIRRSAELLAFAAPPLIRGGSVDDSTLSETAAFLRIDRSQIVDAQWADNGPGWIVVLLASVDEVLALDPVRDHPRHIAVGVVGPYPPGSNIAFELRAFFTDQHGGVREDPVTGSLNASTAVWLLSSGRASAPYIAAQGACLGRSGRIHIQQDSKGTWVGGRTATLFSGICTA